jgi:hypothetical protein
MSINRILNYNENKVKEGKAAFIFAGNYPIDTEKFPLFRSSTYYLSGTRPH